MNQPVAQKSPWLRDLPWDKILIVAVLVSIGTSYILYEAGLLAEAWTAIGIAVAVTVMGVGYAATSMLGLSNGKVTMSLVAALSVIVAVLSIAPVWVTVAPGEPMAQGTLERPGDSLSLPEGAGGPVRLWVKGNLGGQGAAVVHFTLNAAGENAHGKLSRTLSSGRVGRRGRTEIVQEHNSVLVATALGSGEPKLRLNDLEGPLNGPLHVEVFRDYWPARWDIVIAVLVLLAVAALSVRLGATTAPASLAGATLAAGIAAYYFATPDAAVRPEIGALILGGPIGLVAGAALAAGARQLGLGAKAR
jgi:hypothetical protein